MKQLIWKELREQRFIPLAMGAMMIVGLVTWYAMRLWLAAHREGTVLNFEESNMALIIGLYLPGLFAGSGAIAPETGRGTIQFLSTLPTGRRRIWMAKVIAGVATSCASMLAVVVGYWIAVAFLFGVSSLHEFQHTMVRPTQDEAQLLGSAVFFCLYGYAVCLFVSTIVDRTVVAISVGLICSLLCYVGFGAYLSELQIPSRNSWESMNMAIGLTLGLTVAFSVGSMAAFTGPSSGRSKRAWGALLAGIIVVGIWLTLAASVAKSAYAENLALHVVTTGPDSISPTGGRYWDTVSIRVVFPAQAVRTTSCYYKLGESVRPGIDGIDTVISRNEQVNLPYRQPASTRFSSPYVFAEHITKDNQLAITLLRYPKPGVYHDTVDILAADGTVLCHFDIENDTK